MLTDEGNEPAATVRRKRGIMAVAAALVVTAPVIGAIVAFRRPAPTEPLGAGAVIVFTLTGDPGDGVALTGPARAAFVQIVSREPTYDDGRLKTATADSGSFFIDGERYWLYRGTIRTSMVGHEGYYWKDDVFVKMNDEVVHGGRASANAAAVMKRLEEADEIRQADAPTRGQ